MTKQLIFLFTLLLSSCAMVVMPTYHFIFENKTPKDVVLSVFSKGNLMEHFPIEAGKSYDKKIRCDHCSRLPFDENIDSFDR